MQAYRDIFYICILISSFSLVSPSIKSILGSPNMIPVQCSGLIHNK